MTGFSFRAIMRRLEAKKAIESLFGTDTYRAVRARGVKTEMTVARVKAGLMQRATNRRIRIDSGNAIKRNGVTWVQVSGMTTDDAIDSNLLLVARALDDANQEWWLVSDIPGRPSVVAVDEKNRDQILAALSSIGPHTPVYATSLDRDLLLRQISKLPDFDVYREAAVISVLEPRTVVGSSLAYGLETACQIEFWKISDHEQVVAPRENRASLSLSQIDFDLQPTMHMGVPAMVPAALTKRMLDDVTFPVDAVYTWVDGDDENWVESKRRTEALIAGVKYHGEANHAARFRSRDELKYSLRSLEMNTPWFRKIYIVTAGQVPEWLDVDHPKIILINHSDIYPNQSYLPTFNSNSIISRLHHINGLSEHYVYINDDVFFGRPLEKDKFFLSSGIAKVSPSKNRRPFGPSSATDEPHLNLTRNMRSLLENEFGVTISRAIKHTPHPQLRSIHFEMEAKFRDVYEKTWSSRFRHHEDIVADQLHHYYAQIVGKAVPTNLRYNYINILDDKYWGTMQTTLRLRHRDTFCINDAPVDGATPIPDKKVNEFLEQYFPVKSSFER